MAKELTLFNYTQPELMPGLTTKTRNNEAGQPIAVSLTLLKRKDVAKAYGLQVKGQATSDKLVELSDAMKQTAVAEFTKMAASNDFTGAGMTVRKLKDGRMKVTAGLVSINRETKSISPEQLAKALAGMTEDQRIELIEAAEELAKSPVEVASVPATPATKEINQAAA
jgi:hypothetical protein